MHWRILALMMMVGLFSCSRDTVPLKTVAQVDLQKYAGTWYEIALLPQRFEKGCHCTTATYTVKDDYVEVLNRCRKDSPEGKEKKIKGKAFVVEHSGSAKLKVQFFWPFKGDYWIIALADDYSYAMVGAPNREYLWILSRTPKMDQATYDKLVAQAKAQGFPVDQLIKTDQSCK